jgi:hypothetical protein
MHDPQVVVKLPAQSRRFVQRTDDDARIGRLRTRRSWRDCDVSHRTSDIV